MEFLWIDVTAGTTDLIAVGDRIDFSLSTGSPPTSFDLIGNGSILGMKRVLVQGATSGFMDVTFPLRIDLTDKNGFGQLVATDRININADSAGQNAAVVFNWRIYYRYVTVGAQEYIGIVQSQTMS